jgi:hypothetical protein
MVEEHGSGKQLFRFRAWPHVPAIVVAVLTVLAITAVLAASDGAWAAVAPLSVLAAIIGIGAYADCGRAMEDWILAMSEYARRSDPSGRLPVVCPSSFLACR